MCLALIGVVVNRSRTEGTQVQMMFRLNMQHFIYNAGDERKCYLSADVDNKLYSGHKLEQESREK